MSKILLEISLESLNQVLHIFRVWKQTSDMGVKRNAGIISNNDVLTEPDAGFEHGYNLEES